MTNGTKIFWKGDFSNSPKHGVIETVAGQLATVRWEDGRTQTILTFTMVERYGWVIG